MRANLTQILFDLNTNNNKKLRTLNYRGGKISMTFDVLIKSITQHTNVTGRKINFLLMMEIDL